MKAAPKDTAEHIEHGLRLLLRLVANCTPEHQPSEPVLRALGSLIEQHRKGTPPEGFDERLKQLSERLDALKNGGILGEMLQRGKRP